MHMQSEGTHETKCVEDEQNAAPPNNAERYVQNTHKLCTDGMVIHTS